MSAAFCSDLNAYCWGRHGFHTQLRVSFTSQSETSITAASGKESSEIDKAGLAVVHPRSPEGPSDFFDSLFSTCSLRGWPMFRMRNGALILRSNWGWLSILVFLMPRA